MRILFTTQPGFGHLNPMLPYARALRGAGHEVRVASSPPFIEAIEAAGFPGVPVGIPFTWENFATYFPDLAPLFQVDPGMFLSSEFSWTHWTSGAARDLLASFDTWRPDVLFREFAECGATFAGIAADIPVVCSAWSALPTDDRRWSTVLDWPAHLQNYAKVADELGVDASEPGQAWTNELTLTGLPPSWYAGATLPHRVCEFGLFRDKVDLGGPLPEGCDHFGTERPLIYATLGTVYNRFRSLRQSMIDAVDQIDADVVFTVGRNVDSASIGPIPKNVHVEQFVPQDRIISRASLVLSHAGLGTMLGALYHGVPMVSVTIGADQPVNANNAAGAGVAITMPVQAAHADSLAAATKRVLDDQDFARRAAALREELVSLAPVEAVSDLFAEEFG